MHVSNTDAFTVNEHTALLFAPSVGVQVTVVVPSGKQDPDAGAHAVVTSEQLSVAAGVGKLTTAQLRPRETAAVTFCGQALIVGACVSLTVTVKVQSGLPATKQLTVVVPLVKNVPEAGAHVTAPHPEGAVGAV